MTKYPWMAALFTSSGSFFCGGTLVAARHVVTAAHCLYHDQYETQPMAAASVRVRLGDHDLFAAGDAEHEIEVAVAAIIKHEVSTKFRGDFYRIPLRIL